MDTAIPVLVGLALVAAVALCGVGIWAAVEVAKAARSSRRLAEDLDGRVTPLADKVDVSIDAFNAELLRVDMIVDQVEGAVDRFSDAAETVHEVVDAPIHLVSEVAERLRRGFRRRPRHQEAPQGGEVVTSESTIPTDEPAESVESVESAESTEAVEGDLGTSAEWDVTPLRSDGGPSVPSADALEEAEPGSAVEVESAPIQVEVLEVVRVRELGDDGTQPNAPGNGDRASQAGSSESESDPNGKTEEV